MERLALRIAKLLNHVATMLTMWVCAHLPADEIAVVKATRKAQFRDEYEALDLLYKKVF